MIWYHILSAHFKKIQFNLMWLFSDTTFGKSTWLWSSHSWWKCDCNNYTASHSVAKNAYTLVPTVTENFQSGEGLNTINSDLLNPLPKEKDPENTRLPVSPIILHKSCELTFLPHLSILLTCSQILHLFLLVLPLHSRTFCQVFPVCLVLTFNLQIQL